MNYYESIIIAKPELSDKEIESYVAKIEEIFKKFNVNILKFEKLGKKKIAFPIQKEKKGFFMLLHYQADAKNIKEITRSVNLLENTLRFFTVRISETIANTKSTTPVLDENAPRINVADEEFVREEM